MVSHFRGNTRMKPPPRPVKPQLLWGLGMGPAFTIIAYFPTFLKVKVYINL